MSKLLFPAFESFPVINGTGGQTRIYARIREIIPGTGAPWNVIELSSIVFMNSVKPLKDRWRGLSRHGRAWSGLPSNRETMYEYVWRKACRLEDSP